MQDFELARLGAGLGGASRAAMSAALGGDSAVRMSTRFALEYREKGVLKWRVRAKNRVVTTGLNRILNATLCGGNVVTPVASEVIGSGNGSTTAFSKTLAGIAASTGTNPRVIPGSFSITAGAVTGTDNGAGGITGTGIASGTINYQTGAVAVTFSVAPASGSNNITSGYSVFATPALYVGLCGPSVSDGVMTNGSPNLACTGSTPFAAQDAGRAIIVRGGASGGADLVTTIATFTDSGHAVLAANCTNAAGVAGANVIFDARAADTMASHSPWVENTAYTQSTRPQWQPGTPSAGSVDNSAQNAGSGVLFSINANNQQIGGVFLSDSPVVGGTTGLLYGMAPFGSPGFQQMNSNGSLNVIATATAASA